MSKYYLHSQAVNMANIRYLYIQVCVSSVCFLLIEVILNPCISEPKSVNVLFKPQGLEEVRCIFYDTDWPAFARLMV